MEWLGNLVSFGALNRYKRQSTGYRWEAIEANSVALTKHYIYGKITPRSKLSTEALHDTNISHTHR